MRGRREEERGGGGGGGGGYWRAASAGIRILACSLNRAEPPMHNLEGGAKGKKDGVVTSLVP